MSWKKTDIAKKQFRSLVNIHEIDGTINKKSAIKSYSISDLIYDSDHSFYKYYHDLKQFDNLSFKSKASFLANIFDDLDKFDNLKPRKEKTKEKKTNMYDSVSELYNDLLGTYFDK